MSYRKPAWVVPALCLLIGPAANAGCPSTLPEQDFRDCVSALLDDLTSELVTAQAIIGILDSQNAELRAYLTIDPPNNALVISGANVYIQSGSGYTDDNTTATYGDGAGALTGLGNLIIGYNEDSAGPVRTGAHNLVVGAEHGYSSFGGLVAGYNNAINADYAAVSGGSQNRVDGPYAAISGGQANDATGSYAAISGGLLNNAIGDYSAVSGGLSSYASGLYAWVGGGTGNQADGEGASVPGGDGLSEADDYGAGALDDVLADYLTGAHIDGMASKLYVDSAIDAVDHSGYLTGADLVGVASESYVDAYVDAAVGAFDHSGYLTGADLTGYASESYVDGAVSTIDSVAGLSDYLWVDTSRNELHFEGANVHIESGTGFTHDNTTVAYGGTGTGSLTGLGNLIVGYEQGGSGASKPNIGSHNIVVGSYNGYRSYGGIIAGDDNDVYSPYAMVLGGVGNDIHDNATYSVIVGGYHNDIDSGNPASGSDYNLIAGGSSNAILSSSSSSIIGGSSNLVKSAFSASLVGGEDNYAEGTYSAIFAGHDNVVSGEHASIVGGGENGAEGVAAVIVGGRDNLALADYSAVSGGRNNNAADEYTSVTGGQYNYAAGYAATISAGYNNVTKGDYASVYGGTGAYVTTTYGYAP